MCPVLVMEVNDQGDQSKIITSIRALFPIQCLAKQGHEEELLIEAVERGLSDSHYLPLEKWPRLLLRVSNEGLLRPRVARAQEAI
jgi:hypothetical protein